MIPLLERNHLHGLADRRGEEAANLDPQLLEPLGYVVDEELIRQHKADHALQHRALLIDRFERLLPAVHLEPRRRTVDDNARRAVQHLGRLPLELLHVRAGDLRIRALKRDARFDHVHPDELARHTDVNLFDMGSDLLFRRFNRAGDRVGYIGRRVPFAVHKAVILRHTRRCDGHLLIRALLRKQYQNLGCAKVQNRRRFFHHTISCSCLPACKFALRGRKISSDLLLLCEFIVTYYPRSFNPLEQILFQIRPFFQVSGVAEGAIVGVAVGTGVMVGSVLGM